MTHPSQFYIVAATRRSGSSLLCDVLDGTGIAGYPDEFFSLFLRPKWLRRWALPETCTSEAFWQASLLHQTTPNGWHGVKLHSDHFQREPLRSLAQERGVAPEDLLPQMYPGACYIHLTRQDRRGQALSLYRALLTNAWYVPRAGYVPRDPFLQEAAPPPLDPLRVRALETQLAEADHVWRLFFQRHQITPLEVTYAGLCRDVQWETSRVLAFLGLPPGEAYFTVPPRIQKQADAVTDRWREEMERFDHAQLRARTG